MRKPRRSTIQLEPLEDRALLSHGLAGALHAHRAALAARRARPVSVTRPVTIKNTELQGGASGSYNITPARPGVGANYNLSGSGDVNVLGNVQVSGTVTVSVVRGRAMRSGTITLSNGSGMIRIRVQGNSGPLPLSPAATTASPQMAMKYTVIAATGAYRNVHGTGNVSLALASSPRPITTPPIVGSGGSNAGGGQAGQGNGGSGGTGITLPPAPVPPVSAPPVTMPPSNAPPV